MGCKVVHRLRELCLLPFKQLRVHLSAHLSFYQLVHQSDSPRWTFYAKNVDGLEVRECEIEARRTDSDDHNVVDMTAFNTDGFDVTGRNVWIHDCTIWNQESLKGVFCEHAG